MAERLIELCIPARISRMAMVRPAIRRAAEYCGFAETEANDIVLAVAEACQNIVVHAYGPTLTGDIVIEIDRDGDEMTVRLSDTAPKVDQSRIAPRQLDDLRPGGLGTHFLREIMDRVEFEPDPQRQGKMVLVLEKALRTEGDA